jgi:integrase
VSGSFLGCGLRWKRKLLLRQLRSIRELIQQALVRKSSDDYVFTRADGAPVKDFRKGWKKLCEEVGLGGLHIHDFRRSAARELRKAGVPESTIMDIGGWKTREMFKRYAIAAAIAKREQAQAENSHDFSHDSRSDTSVNAESTTDTIN